MADRRTLGSLTVAQVTSRYDVRPRRAKQLAAGVAIVHALLDASAWSPPRFRTPACATARSSPPPAMATRGRS